MGDSLGRQPNFVLPVLRAGAAALPRPLTPLIGREAELAALQRLLQRGTARLVTLTGPPGVGKTRLALAAAEQWRQDTGHAVHYRSLETVRTPARVLPAIAQALGVPAAGAASRPDPLVARLRGAPTLLVLDSFEPVVAAAPAIAGLLLACPQLTVLVTSRAPLRVSGEQVWPVPPLALPGSATAALAACPAVALLLERARAADPHLTLTDADEATLAAICVRLEGIPLAIELAAARLRVCSPTLLLERLERCLPFLRPGARDQPARHQSLHAAIAWSDALLAPPERRLLQRLAVFVDGWTLAAAEAVCPEDEHPATTAVLDGLAELLEQSLIQRGTGADGEPRFGMLAMVREYALGQLAAHGDLERLRARHAAYYQALVAAAAAHLYRADQACWMDRLEVELGNLHAGWRWLVERGAKEAALRFAAALENFWLVHDHLRLGQRWLEESLGMPGDVPPLVAARARGALAALLVRQGTLARARALYEVNLVLAHLVGEDALRAQTLLELGGLAFIAGDLAQAAAHFEGALALGRRIGDRRTVARTLNRLGELARLRGHDAEAARRYEESLAVWRTLAEAERIAMVLHNLAPVVARRGDRRRALALFAESLALSAALRNGHGAALCLAGLAGALGGGWAEALASARALRSLEPSRLATGHGNVLEDPLAAMDRAIETAERALSGEVSGVR
ncbi:MAG: tetratricopeptide repeat protein [Sphaerobacter sp.]|nr:tetratricopeptide repeat protein [Sphaerobacter sp.]